MTGLSIVVPCYNEYKRGTFSQRINLIRDFIKTLDFPCEIIFVNDGSKDSTEYILIQEGVNFISYNKNMGKGYAIRRGINKTSYDKVLIMDADLSVSLDNIPLFYELCEKNLAVIGTRVYKDNRSCFRKFLTKLSKSATSYLNVLDSQCGFKMFFRKDYDTVSEYLCCNRWLGDTELLSYFQIEGISFMESGVEWENCPNSTMKSLPALFSSGLEYIKMRKGLIKYARKKDL